MGVHRFLGNSADSGGGPLTLDRGFTGTLMALKGALRVNDINIDVSVYENCVVRIVEIK